MAVAILEPSVAAVSLNCTQALWHRKPWHVSSVNFNILHMDTLVAHFLVAHGGIPQPWPLDLVRFHLYQTDPSCSGRNERRVQKCEKCPGLSYIHKWSITPRHFHHHHHHRDKAVRISCPTWCLKSHESSSLSGCMSSLLFCPLLCNHVSQSAPQSQKPRGAKSCWPAHTMAASLWCPSVVSGNCNLWLSFYRQDHGTLSCWDYCCDIITVARQHLDWYHAVQSSVGARLSHGKGRGVSAAETVNEHHSDRDTNSPNSGAQRMIQN